VPFLRDTVELHTFKGHCLELDFQSSFQSGMEKVDCRFEGAFIKSIRTEKI